MKEKLNYCTLFNSVYLERGLTAALSLLENDSNSHVYVLALDDLTIEVISRLRNPNITLIDKIDFEDPKLLRTKAERSTAEYCWTCTPSLILYCINKFNLNQCTYIDADLFFFSTPRPLIEEVGAKDILITEHRYSRKYDQSGVSGIYCVQFMYFTNTKHGITALNWWRERCLEWCFAKPENGLFGDQKYLDDWPTRFKNVHVLQNLGGGIAPWNIQQYKVSSINPLKLTTKSDHKDFFACFYHFHSLRFVDSSTVDLGEYSLDKSVIDSMYIPYIKYLNKIKSELESLGLAGKDRPLNSRFSIKFLAKKIRRLMKIKTTNTMKVTNAKAN